MMDNDETAHDPNKPQTPVFTQQPVGTANKTRAGPDPLPGVTVRTLQDNQEDAEFATRLLLEAFRGKMLTALGKENLPIFFKNCVCNHLEMPDWFYSRNFVAEYKGKKTGIVQIKYHGDKLAWKKDHMSEMSFRARFRWGFLFLFDEDIPKGKCYVDHIAVEKEFRGKGIGKVLMDTIEKDAREKNCQSMFLDVVTTNRAKNLYEREGYEVKSTITLCGCMECLLGEKGMYRMEKNVVLIGNGAR